MFKRKFDVPVFIELWNRDVVPYFAYKDRYVIHNNRLLSIRKIIYYIIEDLENRYFLSQEEGDEPYEYNCENEIYVEDMIKYPQRYGRVMSGSCGSVFADSSMGMGGNQRQFIDASLLMDNLVLPEFCTSDNSRYACLSA